MIQPDRWRSKGLPKRSNLLKLKSRHEIQILFF